MVVHIQNKVLVSFVMHIPYPCMILQGTEAPKYEPKNHKHAKSPTTCSGDIGIHGTLAIWAHKRHCYTGKTSIYTNAMVYILMFIAKYTL